MWCLMDEESSEYDFNDDEEREQFIYEKRMEYKKIHGCMPKTPREERFLPTPKALAQVELLAGRGLTNEQIAAYFGIKKTQFYLYRKKYPEINQYIRRGKAKAVAHVSGHLFRQIQDGSTPATIFYLRTQGRWVEPSKEDDKDNKKAASPDVTINVHDPIEAAKTYQELMRET